MVFSSARRDTDKDSNRMQMFDAMREKKFEVHMATTMGVQEKCIDIALAVEMMHYATIPDTYDVGGELNVHSRDAPVDLRKIVFVIALLLLLLACRGFFHCRSAAQTTRLEYNIQVWLKLYSRN